MNTCWKLAVVEKFSIFWFLAICCAVLHTLEQLYMYWVNTLYILFKIITFCLGKYLCMLLYLQFMFMWHNLMRWCFWFNLGRKICKARCWMLPTHTKKKAGLVGFYLHLYTKKNSWTCWILSTFIYKEKSWTCWILSTFICTKKKAGLVGCYLHIYIQRKKLDLLDVIYIYI